MVLLYWGCVTANLAVTKTFSSGITFGTYYARFLVVDMYNAPVFSNVVTIVIQNPIMPTVSGLAVDSTNHTSVHINFITDGDGAYTIHCEIFLQRYSRFTWMDELFRQRSNTIRMDNRLISINSNLD